MTAWARYSIDGISTKNVVVTDLPPHETVTVAVPIGVRGDRVQTQRTSPLASATVGVKLSAGGVGPAGGVYSRVQVSPGGACAMTALVVPRVFPRMSRIATSGIGELVGDGIGVAAESRSGIGLVTGSGLGGDEQAEMKRRQKARRTVKPDRCTATSDLGALKRRRDCARYIMIPSCPHASGPFWVSGGVSLVSGVCAIQQTPAEG